jgi:acyl-CoA reductase-like NAD-dependent aldehyde dehydrogenase
MTTLVSAAVKKRNAFARQGPYGLVIDGHEDLVPETFEAVDPSVGQPWAQLAEASAEDVDRAVRAARAALPQWRRTGPSERQRLLSMIADRIEQDPVWPALLATENGRSIREAEMADVPTAVAIFRYYAGLARANDGIHVATDDPALRVWSTRRPVGVVAALIPWNSPLISTALKVAPALATGNTVVMKPSEFAAASVVEFGLRTLDLLPPGVVNIVTGQGPAAGAALVAHPDIDKISFTGGVPTARHILHAAADTITPALLELGGKSAFVICADANLDAVVADAMMGTVFQNGQVCFAASRLFVHASIRTSSSSASSRRCRTSASATRRTPATQMGPLVSAAHRERVLGHVQRAVVEGATVLCGGVSRELPDPLSGGFYIEPAVVEDPHGSTSLVRERSSGPSPPCRRGPMRTTRSREPTTPSTVLPPASGHATFSARTASSTASRRGRSGSTRGSTSPPGSLSVA